MDPRDNSFIEFVRDQLRDLGNTTFRRMFGGYGIYAGETFFGILHAGRLYFKTNTASRVRYRDRGMEALRATAKQTLTNYYEVPADVLEDSEVLTEWARQSIAVAGIRDTRTAPARSRAKKK